MVVLPVFLFFTLLGSVKSYHNSPSYSSRYQPQCRSSFTSTTALSARPVTKPTIPTPLSEPAILEKLIKNNSENITYFYLKNELKLSEHTLMSIISKYPAILYLQVQENLIPTIDVLKSFGFRMSDIRLLIEKTPTFLG